jgi:hypothetical protein
MTPTANGDALPLSINLDGDVDIGREIATGELGNKVLVHVKCVVINIELVTAKD